MTSSQPLFLLDWDGTIVEGDTLELIASIKCRPSSPTFRHFAEAWVADYTRHEDSYRPSKEARVTIEQEIRWLDSLCDVEEASVRRLEDAGLWRGLCGPSLHLREHPEEEKVDEVQEAASRAVQEGKITFRKGFASLIQSIAHSGGAAMIISVSWSGTWIARAIRAHFKMAGHPTPAAWSIQELPSPPSEGGVLVFANELDPSGSGNMSRGLPGWSQGELGADIQTDRRFNFERFGRGLWTASDKTKAFSLAVLGWRIQLRHDAGGLPASQVKTVYVGDSTTDLGCLMKANVGICLRPSTPNDSVCVLTETLKRLDVRCDDLITAGQVDINAALATSTQQSERLWHAPDFQIIVDSFFPGQGSI